MMNGTDTSLPGWFHPPFFLLAAAVSLSACLCGLLWVQCSKPSSRNRDHKHDGKDLTARALSTGLACTPSCRTGAGGPGGLGCGAFERIDRRTQGSCCQKMIEKMQRM